MDFSANPVASMFAGVPYFHGRLTPEHANFRLNRRGCFDGLYLIYEDAEVLGKYILAICSDERIRIYYLGVSSDGHITYGDGVTVPLMHPHELIHYHLQKCKAFPVRPLIPCLRPMENDNEPMAWQTVTMVELETRMLHAATLTNTGIDNLKEVLRSQRKTHMLSIAKELHHLQSWYHGPIDRDEAESRLDPSGKSQTGKFLIRERDDGSFALSMRYKDQFRHYTINKVITDEGEMLSLDDEPGFFNLMDIIEHYSTKPKSFVLTLTSPCVCPDYQKQGLPALNSKAMEILKDYNAETRHLQNPDFDLFVMDRFNKNKTTNKTENSVLVIKEDPAKINVKQQVRQQKENDEIVPDEDDAALDEFLSSVLPVNDNLLVTRIDVQNCTIKTDKL